MAIPHPYEEFNASCFGISQISCKSSPLYKLIHLLTTPSTSPGHFLRLQARTTNDTSVLRSLQYIAQNPVAAFVNFTPVVSFFSDHRNYPSDSAMYPGMVNGDTNSYTGSALSKTSKASKASSRGAVRLQQQVDLEMEGSVDCLID